MIPFKKVYRMRHEGEDYWTVVMGLTPLPNLEGLWMLRASSTKPSQDVYGEVFEGSEGRLVVTGRDGHYVFEPLTLERWEDMKDSVQGFDQLRKGITTDAMLQGWYWDEFAEWEDEEVTQDAVMKMLHTAYA